MPAKQDVRIGTLIIRTVECHPAVMPIRKTFDGNSAGVNIPLQYKNSACIQKIVILVVKHLKINTTVI